MNKISIALCTFNGAPYLSEQLDSYLSQTRQPDEVIICDDRSSDHTSSILDNFAKKAPFDTKIIINDSTLGITKNFEKAIRLCTGDVIALSDQDDVWLPNKLHLIENEFIRNKGIQCVFSDAQIVDKNLTPLNYSIWTVAGLSERKLRKILRNGMFPNVLNQYLVTGCTMAFRSEFRKYGLPIPPSWFHDAWISFMSSCLGEMKPLPLSLVFYRQHQSNQIGGLKRNLFFRFKESLATDRKAYFQSELDRYRAAHERLKQIALADSHKVELIWKKIHHLETRQKLPGNRLARIPIIIGGLLQLDYHRYSRGTEIALQDLLMK